jgi:GGDEF domain-containing protein
MAVLTLDTFGFVLTNELKRALRSQNFATLVLIEPRGRGTVDALSQIAGLINPELRETDLLAADDTCVSMVLLDADLQHSERVIDRVIARLEHYQFATPLDIQVGAACCPTHGADAETLKRVAIAARARIPRRDDTRGSAHA